MLKLYDRENVPMEIIECSKKFDRLLPNVNSLSVGFAVMEEISASGGRRSRNGRPWCCLLYDHNSN